jgi:hypothetical protein
MEAAADPSTDAIDVALTAPTASTATTASITKQKAKMKKELGGEGGPKPKEAGMPGRRAGNKGRGARRRRGGR